MFSIFKFFLLAFSWRPWI